MNAQLFDKKNANFKRKIISFAYLAQASKNPDDLIGGIASIFKPIAKQFAGDIFDPEKFCLEVDELYGLKINPWAIQDLIGRLVQHGILIEHKVIAGVKQYLYAEITQEFAAVTENDIKDVVEKFIIFSESKLSILKIEIDRDTLSESFLSHLSDLNFIRTTLKPDEYIDYSSTQTELTINDAKKEWRTNVTKESRLNSLCSGFVLDVYNKDKQLYILLLKIVSGALVAEVVLNFQEPAIEASLDRVNIILDTPFLMDFLNLTSEKENEFASELCKQVESCKGNLCVFEHSIDELEDNLKAVLRSFDSRKAFGATGRRLRKSTFNAYLRQVLKDIRGVIKKQNIRVLNNLTAESSYRIFSKKQEESLCENFGYYNNHKALERDALSIALTMRHRNGIKINLSKFYNCNYIFLTENSIIPDKSRDYMIRNNILSEKDLPPAVSGRYLSGLLWVLFGAKGKDLSKQLLLANCAAALEPTREMVDKMHRFLADTNPIQAELFETLMGEERAGQYLMQSSLGDSTLLTQDNAVEVLHELEKSLTEKIECQASEKINAIELEKNSELKKVDSKHEQEMSEQRDIQEDLKQRILDGDAERMTQNSLMEDTCQQMEKIKS